MLSVPDRTISEFGGPSTSSEYVTKSLVSEGSSFAATSFRAYLEFARHFPRHAIWGRCRLLVLVLVRRFANKFDAIRTIMESSVNMVLEEHFASLLPARRGRLLVKNVQIPQEDAQYQAYFIT